MEKLDIYYEDLWNDNVNGIMYMLSQENAISIKISIPKVRGGNSTKVFTKLKTPFKIYNKDDAEEQKTLKDLEDKIGKYSNITVIIINYCGQEFILPITEEKSNEILNSMQSFTLDLSSIEPIYEVDWGYENAKNKILSKLNEGTTEKTSVETREFKI